MPWPAPLEKGSGEGLGDMGVSLRRLTLHMGREENSTQREWGEI